MTIAMGIAKIVDKGNTYRIILEHNRGGYSWGQRVEDRWNVYVEQLEARLDQRFVWHRGPYKYQGHAERAIDKIANALCIPGLMIMPTLRLTNYELAEYVAGLIC